MFHHNFFAAYHHAFPQLLLSTAVSQAYNAGIAAATSSSSPPLSPASSSSINGGYDSPVDLSMPKRAKLSADYEDNGDMPLDMAKNKRVSPTTTATTCSPKRHDDCCSISTSTSPLHFFNHLPADDGNGGSLFNHPRLTTASPSDGTASTSCANDESASTSTSFQCHQCGKELPTQLGLKRHMFHHRKPFINKEDFRFKCEICPAAFAYRTSFQYHRISHSLDGSEQMPNGLYKCHQCNSTFGGIKALKRHKMNKRCTSTTALH